MKESKPIFWVVVLAVVVGLGLYVRSYRFQANPDTNQNMPSISQLAKTTPIDSSATDNPSVQITDTKGDIVEDPSLKVKGLRLIVCGVARELKGQLCKVVFWTDKQGVVGDAGYIVPEHKGETFETIVFVPLQNPPVSIQSAQLRVYRVSDEKMLVSMELFNKPKTNSEQYDDDDETE